MTETLFAGFVWTMFFVVVGLMACAVLKRRLDEEDDDYLPDYWDFEEAKKDEEPKI